MKVVLRVDASIQMGTGHVMRCLTLADELRERGADCHFICRSQPGDMSALIQSRGYSLTMLISEMAESRCVEDDGALTPHANWLDCGWKTDADQVGEVVAVVRPDWLIVDHYALDACWERALTPHYNKLMVIDDLADRSHVCDLLLDQNYYSDMETRYRGLVPPYCEMLLGSHHVLLRPEFLAMRDQLRERDGCVRRILVFFGGSDPTNQTQIVLDALAMLDIREIAVDVVIGGSNPHSKQLEARCRTMPNVVLHRQVSNMAELIELADLGIGAGGSAMWERCYLGLPTITVVFADNQLRTTEDVAALGAIHYLGRSESLAAAEYAGAIGRMIDSPAKIRRISEVSRGLVHPGTGRVVDVMEGIYQTSSLAKFR